MGVTVSTQKNEQDNSIHQGGGKGGSHLRIGGNVGGNNGGGITSKNDGSLKITPVLMNLDSLDLKNLHNLPKMIGGHPIRLMDDSVRFVKLDDSIRPLMNLATDVKEYHAKKGSATVFDFKMGDPLKTTKVNDLHKDAGAQLHFSGSNGKQELGVTRKFLDGSEKRLDTHVGIGSWGAKGAAMNNHFDTLNDNFKAFDHDQKDVFGLILLEI